MVSYFNALKYIKKGLRNDDISVGVGEVSVSGSSLHSVNVKIAADEVR